MAKIAKTTPKFIGWSKNFVPGNFLKMVQNGPIRYDHKSDIWRCLHVILAGPLENFRMIFSKKNCFFYRDWCIRSNWYCILLMYLTLWTHSDKFRSTWYTVVSMYSESFSIIRFVLHTYFITNDKNTTNLFDWLINRVSQKRL